MVAIAEPISRFVLLKTRFVRHFRRWAELPEEVREATLDLVAEPYLRTGYPTAEDFAAAFGVRPGTAEYAAAWRREIARRREMQRAIYRDEDWVYVLGVRSREGRLHALGTIMVVRGARDLPLAAAIGDPASTLPTLRILHFACGPGAGLDPAAVTEARLAEFCRMCVLQQPELLALVGAGVLTLAEAAYIENHAFSELFALAYHHDQARGVPPLAYLGNSPPWMISALERRGLAVRRLYLAAGAEPTARVLGSGQGGSAYFGRWRAVLATVVPGEIMAGGTAAAVAHLVRTGFEAWDRLGLSLPFWILNDAQTVDAMARLTRAVGLDAAPEEGR